MKGRNRFPGRCVYCGLLVKAFQGKLVEFGSTLGTAHDRCVQDMSGESKPAPPVEPSKGS